MRTATLHTAPAPRHVRRPPRDKRVNEDGRPRQRPDGISGLAPGNMPSGRTPRSGPKDDPDALPRRPPPASSALTAAVINSSAYAPYPGRPQERIPPSAQKRRPDLPPAAREPRPSLGPAPDDSRPVQQRQRRPEYPRSSSYYPPPPPPRAKPQYPAEAPPRADSRPGPVSGRGRDPWASKSVSRPAEPIARPRYRGGEPGRPLVLDPAVVPQRSTEATRRPRHVRFATGS